MFKPSTVNWMEADLNVSLLTIVRKGRGLSRLNDWRSPACFTREKSDISLDVTKLQAKKETHA